MLANAIRYEKRKQEIEYRDLREGGRLNCSAHLHRDIELVCMYEGETKVCADTMRETLCGGDIFLTFPNQIHSYETKGVEKYIIFFIKPDLIPDLMNVFTTNIPSSPVIKNALRDPHILRTVEALLDACKDPRESPYIHSLRRGYLLALFSELMMHMTLMPFLSGESGALRSVVSYCTSNFSEDLSLSLLEEKLHLNKYYISHIFSEKLGLRFNDYINSLRVSEACRYLLNSNQSITDISEQVGFNTLRTFNRAFIKHIGISPSEYRKQK